MRSQPQSQECIFIKNGPKEKVVMIKYKYKYTNTNTQIHKYKFAHTKTNTNRGAAPKSNFELCPNKKSLHENGHISGTVRPTSLQQPSNRSSWRARLEKHLRGSLTCPGNTGEPEAPVLGCNRHIEFGSVWVGRPKND